MLAQVSEGDGVVLRSPSGCDVVQAASSLNWPHDALLLPTGTAGTGTAAAAAAANRTAGLATDGGAGPYAVFVGQLDGRRISKHARAGGGGGGAPAASGGGGGSSSPYGRLSRWRRRAEAEGAEEEEAALVEAAGGQEEEQQEA